MIISIKQPIYTTTTPGRYERWLRFENRAGHGCRRVVRERKIDAIRKSWKPRHGAYATHGPVA